MSDRVIGELQAALANLLRFADVNSECDNELQAIADARAILASTDDVPLLWKQAIQSTH